MTVTALPFCRRDTTLLTGGTLFSLRRKCSTLVHDHYFGTVYFSQSVVVTLTRTFAVAGSDILIGSHVNILNVLDDIKDFFYTIISPLYNFFFLLFLRS